MNNRELVEQLAAEIEQAIVAGDHDRAQKLADLQARAVAGISRGTVTDGPRDIVVPPARQGQLASIARRISTEALSAALAAERANWQAVHASYDRLAQLFAEYRLAYVQALSANGDDSVKDLR